MRRRFHFAMRVVAFAAAGTAPFALHVDDLFAGQLGLAAVAKMPRYEATTNRGQNDSVRVADEANAVRKKINRVHGQAVAPMRR